MTSLFGSPNERWPLTRAVDAMVTSARRAGFPAMLWLAGLVYPSLSLGIGVINPILSVLEATTPVKFEAFRSSLSSFLVGMQAAPSTGQPTLFSLLNPSFGSPNLPLLLLLLPLILAVARLSAGLAMLSEDQLWKGASGGGRTPTLRQTWKAGNGLSLSALGLVLSFPLLSLSAVLCLLAPIVMLLNFYDSIGQFPSLLALLLAPVGLIAITYGVVLQVLIQLALHSLARNRRGCVSALTHAWRLVRNSPWSAGRATVVDLALQGSILALILILDRTLGLPGAALGWILLGFVGVVRSGYWAETYEGLGGLSTALVDVSAVAPRRSAAKPQ